MSFADSPFSSAPFAATGENNATVALTGFQLNIAENNLTVSAGGSVVTGSEENTIETFLGTVIAESESIVEVTGVSAKIDLPNITDGLTISNTYQSITNLGTITGRGQNTVFQSDSNGILLKSSYTDPEIWWEVGGENVGAYLGIAKINDAYFIRFRTGSGKTNQQSTGGGTAGGSNSRAVVNLSVSDSSVASYFDDERHIITWAIEIPDATYLAGRLRLWIDGNEVITYDPFNDDGNVIRNGNWAGTASAGYGQGYFEIAGGDGTFDSGATQYQTFTGTSVGSNVFLNAYENQTIIYSGSPVEVNGNANVDVTGIELSTELGTETIVANSNVDVTGEVLSTELGTEVVTASALVQPTGLEISFAEGTVVTTGTANIDVIGEQIDSALGIEVIVADANVDVIGLEASLTDGDVEVIANADVTVTGLNIQFTEGTAEVTGTAIVDVTGIEVATELGTETVTGDANIDVTGLAINFTEGEVIVIGEVVVDVTGSEATFATGTVEVFANATAETTGLEVSSQSGNINIVGSAIVEPTGQVLSIGLGQVTVVDAWQQVDPSANNAFSAVSTGASNTWTEVAA